MFRGKRGRPSSGDSTHATDAPLPVTEVFGKNGVKVKCTYLFHPAFNASHNLWLSLHLLFIKLASLKHHSCAVALRTAYYHLLDFVGIHNGTHSEPLWITHINDLTASFFKSFENHLRRNDESTLKAQNIKTALKQGAKLLEAIPMIALPSVKVDTGPPTEPLNDDGVASLSAAGKLMVDRLREKLKTRAAIDACEPYSLEDLVSLYTLTMSREEILVWCKYRIDNKLWFHYESVIARIKICSDAEVRSMLSHPKPMKALRAFYKKNMEGVKVPKNYSSNLKQETRYYKADLDPNRVAKTLISNGYPLEFSLDEIHNEYNTEKLITFGQLDNVVKHIIHKLHRTNSQRTILKLPRTPSSVEHLLLYYPSKMEMSALTAFMMLQAGWNKESVTDIDPENFEHPLTATIENRLKIICAEKFRSQGGKVPYDNPTTAIARSDSDNPYSLYNLILLAKDLSAPLAKYAEDLIDPFRNKPTNTMLSFLNGTQSANLDNERLVSTIDYRATFSAGIKEFLKEYEVIDAGARVTSAANLTGRLRATWVLYNVPTTPSSFLSFLLGHEYRDTTDESYDSSPTAHRRRMNRLRSALEEIISLLRAGKVEGLLGKTAQAKATTKVIFFHLPPFERALWGCGNQEKPDWPNAPKLKQGEKCFSIEHCLECTQLWIIEDSLPYLLERLEHVEEILTDRANFEFGSRLEVERDRIQNILEDWPDDGDLGKAIAYRNKHKPLLPRNLADLKLLLKTSDSD